MRLKWIVTLVVAALAVWAAYGFFLEGNGKGKDKAPAVKVTLAPVLRQDVPLTVQLPGNVIAYETVSIKSRVDSQVTEVAFHDGDAVQQGQVLFKLDDRSIKAQISQMQADLQKQKAQLVANKLAFDRTKALIESKAVSPAQFDADKAAYESQLAAVASAQANLDNANVMLSYCVITAPITGRAGTINVTLGNNVKANDTQALVTINRVSPIRVQFAIPERYYEQVKAAMAQAAVAVHASRAQAEQQDGTLEYIDNTIDASTGAFIARAVFTNEKEALWPGMFTTVTLELGREQHALTVPSVAVQGDAGSNFVFKDVDNKAVKTPVEISRNTGEIAVISKGLADGDQVLVDGILRVTDGAAIDASVPAAPATPAKPAS